MRPLADGTIAVGLFNRGRYEIEPPPRPKKGESAPKPIWKLRDRATGKVNEFDGEADAEAACENGRRRRGRRRLVRPAPERPAAGARPVAAK